VDADGPLDIIILIFVLAIMMPIMVNQALPLYQTARSNFDDYIVDTALPTTGTLKPTPREFNTDDAMLMLAIQDEYCPQPKEVQINVGTTSGPVIDINSSFVAYKSTGLSEAYSVMPASPENVNMSLYVGPSGMRKWVVSN
jgi:hypothetical protein